MKKIIFLFATLLANIISSYAQASVDATEEAVVGQPCPDVFFNRTINFNKSSFYLHELRGKWVILDLWSMGCAGCIASFPQVSKEQEKFKDKVQFLMGTFDDSKGNNAAIYNRVNDNLHLKMPCVFNGKTDSTDFFKQFKVGALPFVVVIDPNGIIKAVTGVPIREEQMEALLNGDIPSFLPAAFSDTKRNVTYDRHGIFLGDGNGGAGLRSDFEYRSILSKGNPAIVGNDAFCIFLPASKKANTLKYLLPGRIELLNMALENIYGMAFFGDYNLNNLNRTLDSSKFVWPYPILETKDTRNFDYEFGINKNIYCYSLIVPQEEGVKENMMAMMQSDLNRYFKYRAHLETRAMPVWKLVIADKELAQQLKTKGGKTEVHDVILRIKAKMVNVSMNRACEIIRFSASLGSTPFLDDTDIDYNIDLEFEYLPVPGNLEIINSSLMRHGLKIVKSEMKMPALVIRDAEPTSNKIY